MRTLFLLPALLLGLAFGITLAPSAVAAPLSSASGQVQSTPGKKVVVGPGTSVSTEMSPLFGNPIGSWCTVGSVGRDNFGRLVAIMAGHCNTRKGEHQPVRLSDTLGGRGAHIGTYETVTSFPSGQTTMPVNSRLDYAVILLDERLVEPSMTTPSGHVIDKNYTGPIHAGLEMAHYGQVSSWVAGTVSAHVDNVIYSANVVNLPGDSGGPVRIGSNGSQCGAGCGFAGVNSAVNPLLGSLGAFQFTGIAGILADIAAQGPKTVGIGFRPGR